MAPVCESAAQVATRPLRALLEEVVQLATRIDQDAAEVTTNVQVRWAGTSCSGEMIALT
jgi:hypothetical protein